jgi:hypothetical protein
MADLPSMPSRSSPVACALLPLALRRCVTAGAPPSGRTELALTGADSSADRDPAARRTPHVCLGPPWPLGDPHSRGAQAVQASVVGAQSWPLVLIGPGDRPVLGLAERGCWVGRASLTAGAEKRGAPLRIAQVNRVRNDSTTNDQRMFTHWFGSTAPRDTTMYALRVRVTRVVRALSSSSIRPDQRWHSIPHTSCSIFPAGLPSSRVERFGGLPPY